MCRLGGQKLFTFSFLSIDVAHDFVISTCDGSRFDTYLVLFDRHPNPSIPLENGAVVKEDVSPIAKSANDILCDDSISHATIITTLTEGTY